METSIFVGRRGDEPVHYCGFMDRIANHGFSIPGNGHLVLATLDSHGSRESIEKRPELVPEHPNKPGVNDLKERSVDGLRDSSTAAEFRALLERIAVAIGVSIA